MVFLGKRAFSTLVAGCGPRPQHWHVGESGFDPLSCNGRTRNPSFLQGFIRDFDPTAVGSKSFIFPMVFEGFQESRYRTPLQ